MKADTEARGGLNPGSFIPLYVQLTEILQERIERRQWVAGSRFASEAELCSEFQVSRAVVRPALTILENNGLIIRIKGRGTFVAPEKSNDWPRGLVRDLTVRSSPGRTVEVTDVKLTVPNKELRELLQLSSKTERIVHAASLISVDDRLLAFRDSFISASRVPGIRQALRPGPAAVNGRLRLRLGRFETTIETSFCTPFEAALFRVNAGSPTLLVRCIEYATRSSKAQAVEMARMVYRADIVTLLSDSR
jgi:DNA-binding GntR family transcriptional regulator